MTDTTTAVRIVRTLPAPPDRVYHAWLDPEVLRLWFAPTGFEVAQAVVEPRVGGRHSVHHLDGDQDVGGFESRIVELEPDRRIVFAWGFVGPDHLPDPAHESRLTIELRPVGEAQTELTLLHERLAGLRAALPHVADGVATGWEQALGKLAAVVAR